MTRPYTGCAPTTGVKAVAVKVPIRFTVTDISLLTSAVRELRLTDWSTGADFL